MFKFLIKAGLLAAGVGLALEGLKKLEEKAQEDSAEHKSEEEEHTVTLRPEDTPEDRKKQAAEKPEVTEEPAGEEPKASSKYLARHAAAEFTEAEKKQAEEAEQKHAAAPEEKKEGTAE